MININKFTQLIPNAEQRVKRLKFLKEQAQEIRFAAFGKYNHGKSTLLNAMIGKKVFQTADKRETTKNAEYKHDGIVWIDTPGLDADINRQDDKKAMTGAFQMADFIFLVHRADAGELDRYELKLYKELLKQNTNSSDRICLVLTQIDQIVAQKQLDKVISKIKRQIPKLTIIPVSAKRYMTGLRENQSIFVERSNIKQLFHTIAQAKDGIDSLRQSEMKSLIETISFELEKKRQEIERKLRLARLEKSMQLTTFNDDLDTYLQKVTT